jgi:HAD superfamily hydrolase (TIGR01509 family)
MEMKEQTATLFDFDGVIMDTEAQYSVFWNEQGRKYLGVDDFGSRIKGQTLTQMFEKHFAGVQEVQRQIALELDLFEENMTYEYLSGVEDFFDDLHRNGVKMALVTSSNDKKMSNVYRRHPAFKQAFDEILTADRFSRSKPDPECFLLGMQLFQVPPRSTYVFEDSFYGLQAGMATGATVIGLATTNSREAIAGKAHYVMDDFSGMTFEKMLAIQRT